MPTSYLQMNTTDDSFPILVRKDSYAAPSVAIVPDNLHESRKSISASAQSNMSNTSMSRNARPAPRGMLDDQDMTQSRLLSDFTMSASRPYTGE